MFASELANSYHEGVQRALLNASLSVAALRAKSDAFVPYSASHLSNPSRTKFNLFSFFLFFFFFFFFFFASRFFSTFFFFGLVFPHLNLDASNRFHTSAIIASAMDSITMPYRFDSMSKYSISNLTSTVAPGTSFFFVLVFFFFFCLFVFAVTDLKFSFSVPSMNVASLATSLPLPLEFERSQLTSLLTKEDPLFKASFMTALLDNMDNPRPENVAHKRPFAESALLRGIPEWARKAPEGNQKKGSFFFFFFFWPADLVPFFSSLKGEGRLGRLARRLLC